jgi:hypothetical protein
MTAINWIGLAAAFLGLLGIHTIILLMAITDNPVTDIQKEILTPALVVAVTEIVLAASLTLVLIGSSLR